MGKVNNANPIFNLCVDVAMFQAQCRALLLIHCAQHVLSARAGPARGTPSSLEEVAVRGFGEDGRPIPGQCAESLHPDNGLEDQQREECRIVPQKCRSSCCLYYCALVLFS